ASSAGVPRTRGTAAWAQGPWRCVRAPWPVRPARACTPGPPVPYAGALRGVGRRPGAVTGRSHSLPLEDTVELLTDPDAWVALLTLTALEVVLGIDNIVFISILAGKLPAEQRARARQVGLFAAMAMRILLL